MHDKNFTGLLGAALLGATLALSAAAPSASALPVIHNGIGTSGEVIGATGDVQVSLNDPFAAPPNSLNTFCDDEGQDVCLAKVWWPDSQNDIHQMAIDDQGGQISVTELIFNATGVSWTDYHIEIEGGDLLSAGAVLVLVSTETQEFMFINGGLTQMIMDDSLWIFFDEPFETLPLMMPGPVELGLLVGFSLNDQDEGSYFIQQHPSLGIPEPGTLALFGLGLAGLAAARRRKIA